MLLFRLYEKVTKETFLRSFCFCKKNQKVVARTRQKLPVPSFGVSETAETGSIVSGREQDDHVSRSRLTSCDLGSKRYTGMLFIEIVAFRV